MSGPGFVVANRPLMPCSDSFGFALKVPSDTEFPPWEGAPHERPEGAGPSLFTQRAKALTFGRADSPSQIVRAVFLSAVQTCALFTAFRRSSSQ